MRAATHSPSCNPFVTFEKVSHKSPALWSTRGHQGVGRGGGCRLTPSQTAEGRVVALCRVCGNEQRRGSNRLCSGELRAGAALGAVLDA